MNNSLLQHLPRQGVVIALGMFLYASPSHTQAAGWDFGDDYERRCMADAIFSSLETPYRKTN
ncbi:hypothetical protein [Vibrio variabilis]|uniref:hypothetical protein n=1 Tax=Vibrio variabilis TaxID=990271 RepID=UPI000DDBC98B|nr:hypothetical protein [Vibrio variabilis]